MSDRATRPRSRRGRHPPPVSVSCFLPHPPAGILGAQACVALKLWWGCPPQGELDLMPVCGWGRDHSQGELDPVAESSEEVESTSGSFEAKAKLLQEHSGSDQQGPGGR